MLDGENTVIESAVRGEASAFGRLYDHYQPKIYRFIFVKVSHREEAEDLTHQVFLSAWQNIGSYVSQGFPFSSWLYRIARNRVIDHYRTKRSLASIDEVNPEEFAVPGTEELLANDRLELARVLTALKELKPEYQDVIVMRFIEDLSPREIATALDKSEGAIKLIQHRAIKQLRETLNKQ